MKKYKVPNLNAKTPQKEQTKLLSALESIKGVESAKLHLESSEFSLSPKGNKEPKQEDIASAASEAGFSLAK